MAGMFSKDGKAKMTDSGDGIWTYTSQPLDSELYWYNFIVDDDSVRYDKRNKNTTRDIATTYNYFIIKGGIADNYVDATGEKGVLKYVWYPSKLNGMSKRRMAVYLPYGYTSSSHKYPVLYLLHGSGGDETSWADCGRLTQIMDNLIAQGLCRPMIVVMPNGNVDLAAAPGSDPDNPDVKPSGKNTNSMLGKFEKSFVPEIVTYIDKNYRTIPDKHHRAIAGLSLGGLHTLYTSLNNPETFDYVGLFSAQTSNALGDKGVGNLKSIGESWNQLKQALPFIGGGSVDRKITNITGGQSDENLAIYENIDGKLKAFYESDPKLVYIAVGKDDFTKKLNDNLRKNSIKVIIPTSITNQTEDTHGATGANTSSTIYPDYLKTDIMKEHIRALLEDLLPLVDLDSDFLFAELDSLGVTTILMVLSQEYGIELVAKDATPKNLKSLDSLVAMVNRKLAEKQ